MCGAQDVDEKKKKHDAAHARGRPEGRGAILLPRAARAFPGRHRRGKTAPHAPPPGLPAALQPGKGGRRSARPSRPFPRQPRPRACPAPETPPRVPVRAAGRRGPGSAARGLGAGTPGPGAGTPGFRAGFGRRPQSRLLRGASGLAAVPAEPLLAAARGYPVSAAPRPMSPGRGARRGGPGLRGPGAGWSRTYAEEAGLGSGGRSARPGPGERDGDAPRAGAQVAPGPAPTAPGAGAPLPTPASDGRAPGGSSAAAVNGLPGASAAGELKPLS